MKPPPGPPRPTAAGTGSMGGAAPGRTLPRQTPRPLEIEAVISIISSQEQFPTLVCRAWPGGVSWFTSRQSEGVTGHRAPCQVGFPKVTQV